MDWNKLKKEYVKGGISYRQLSEKYGVPYGTLVKVAAKQKWGDLRKESGKKADKKLIEAVSSQNAATTNKIYAAADKMLERLVEALEMVSAEEIIMDKKGFRSLTGALNDIKAIKDMKSGIDVEEQMARIEKLRKDAEKEDDSRDVEIRITGWDDAWSK